MSRLQTAQRILIFLFAAAPLVGAVDRERVKAIWRNEEAVALLAHPGRERVNQVREGRITLNEAFRRELPETRT